VAKIAAINKEKTIMKNFIYNEMMVHVALCTNKDPKSVLFISNDADGMVSEVARHEGMSADVIAANIEALRGVGDAVYDVVISEMQSDAAGYAHINRVLKSDGLLVTTHPSLDNIEENKQIISILGKYAKIVMPFNIGNGQTALLASKEYHPTADIILHRADMLDGLEFYNCDVHPAAFAMGNYIRKTYLGIIKN
jgi:spermidine synthase